MSYRIGYDLNWYLWAGEVNICSKMSVQVGVVGVVPQSHRVRALACSGETKMHQYVSGGA